jgi:predicted metal-dependent hydrolase
MIRLMIPTHLSRLANSGRHIELEVNQPVTLNAVLDALEAHYPMLRGTLRDHQTKQRRPFIRFFALGQDLSNEPPDTPLPDEITQGAQPLLVIGAMAGG